MVPSYRLLYSLIYFLALVLHSYSYANEVSNTRSFRVSSNEAVLVLVDNFSDELTVTLRPHNDIQSSNSVSKSANLFGGALFTPTASNKSLQFKVTVERRFQSQLATNFKLLVVPIAERWFLRLVTRLNDEGRDLTNNAVVEFSRMIAGDYEEIGFSREDADRLVYYFSTRKISIKQSVDSSDSLAKCNKFVSSLSLQSEKYRAELSSQCHFYHAVALMDKGLFRDSYGQYQSALSKIRSIEEKSSRLKLLKYFLQGRVAETLYIASFYDKDMAGVAESGRLMLDSIGGLRVAGSYRRMAEVQNIFAYFLDGNGEHAEAIHVSQESVNNHKKAGPNSQMAASLNNLALLLHNSSRTSEAIEKMVAALKLKDELGQSRQKGAMLRNLGRFYLSVGDHESANDTAELALELALDRDSPRRVALSHHLLGSIQLERKEFNLAKQSLLSSESVWRLLNSEEKVFASNVFSVRVLLLRLFTQLLEKEQATEVFESIKSEAYQMIDEHSIGDYKDKKRFIRFLLSLFEFEIAFGYRLGGIDSAEILNEFMTKSGAHHSIVDDVAQFYYLSLSSASKQNDLSSARKILNESLGYLHQVEVGLDSIFVGPTIGRIRAKLAGLYLSILFSQYEVSELDNKKVLAWEALAVTELIASNALANSHINSIKQLNSQSQNNVIANKRMQKISVGLDSAIVGSNVNDALGSQAQEMAGISSSVPIGLKSSDYKEIDALVMELKDSSQKLEQNDLALTFFKNHEFALVVALDAEGVRLHKIENSVLLNEQINLFREKAKKGPEGIGRLINDLARTISLENMLDADNFQKVLIKAHGSFNFLPLSTVIDMLTNRHAGKATENRHIRVSSILAYLNDNFIKFEGLYEKDFGVFVSPRFSGGGSKGWASTLAELPYSQTEAGFRTNNFPSNSIALYSGLGATKSNVLSDEFRLSTISHISTHGYFDPSNPSIVGFATSGSVGSDSSNFVSINEVLLHNYASKLLVVSGCETYLGKDIGGWGLMGLSNAFIAKGTGSVIGTLWPVPDRSTSRLMETFYTELASNDGDVSLALSAAKNALKRSPRFKSPFYWGGFVLTSTNQQFDRINIH